MIKGRILIIEDEAIVADDILFCLREAGHEVPLVCASGEEALEALEKQSVDLVLVDILLAGEIDGIETARQLRKRFQLPVVYLTSFTNESIIERAKETTPSGYIVKPFKRRELLATVEMALYRGESPSDFMLGSTTLLSGHWLLNAWSEWLQESLNLIEKVGATLSGDIQKDFRKWYQQSGILSDDLQYFAGLSPTDLCLLDRFFSLLVKLFVLQHPGRKLEFISEPKLDSIRCAPLLLIEILLSALDILALTVPENELRLRVGLVPAKESNIILHENSAENNYCFQIRLNNAAYSGKDTTFALLESSPKYPLILDALEKFGGTMIPFSGKSEGEFGFDIFVPLF